MLEAPSYYMGIICGAPRFPSEPHWLVSSSIQRAARTVTRLDRSHKSYFKEITMLSRSKRVPGYVSLGLAGIVFCLVFAQVALSQLPVATVLGVVKDASGAVVPGVAVTAKNLGTGLTRTANTASDGSYRLSALPVGSYEVSAAHTGFQTEVQRG